MIISLINFTAVAADFNKEALEIIANRLKQNPGDLNSIEKDPVTYLSVSIQLFNHIKPERRDFLQDSIMSITGLKLNKGTRLTLGGFVISFGGEHVIVNNQSQKIDIVSIKELEEALGQGHWVSVRNCLLSIAKTALKILINSKNAENINAARRWATNPSLEEYFGEQLRKTYNQTLALVQ
jgi:hypothetical protein